MSNLALPSLIVELDSSAALDSEIVGSKASSVADLAETGVTVPAGFVIPAGVFDEFIEPIKFRISTILDSVDAENPASPFEAAEAIGKLFRAQTMPDELAAAVAEKLSGFPSESGLAVRSSATVEDLEGASFAGMYDTFLDATDAKSVVNRIRDVWVSYYTGRAISYRDRQNIPHDSGLMAVLIMQLVNADAGGVVFTRDPRDGTDQILIYVALGLGEGVVRGIAPSDSFVLSPDGSEITTRNVIDKEWMFVSPSAGELELVPVPASIRSGPALSVEQLQAIANAAITIKNSSGDDRDIEFAVKDNVVHILQSRPITTGAKKETEFPVEWDNPEQEKLYWRAGGKKPNLPLVNDYVVMAGEAEKRCVDTVGQYMGRFSLKKWFHGYIYTAELPRDPEVTRATLFKHHLQGRRLLKKGTNYFDEVVKPMLLSNLDELVQTRPKDDDPIPKHVAFLRKVTRISADHMNDLHWRSWGGFDPKERKNKTSAFTEITGKPDVEASSLLLGIDHMTARLTKRLVGMAELAKSDPWLSNVFDTRDYQALAARGAGTRPAVRKFRSRFKSMMKIWGCRNGIGYGSAWKPTDPTWDMKPEIPLDAIGSYLRQDLLGAGRTHKDLVKKREAAIREVRKQIGRNKDLRERFDFELYLETSRIQIMENHNYLIEQRTFGEYRESSNRAGMALFNGGWIDSSDDIFRLRLEQLDDAVSANDYSGLRALVVRAKQTEVEYLKYERPDFLGTKPPDDEDTEKEEKPLRGISEDGQILHGEPSAPGSFTGTARVVITRTATPPNVIKGDILVTDNTGPDWVPIFPLLGGLVLDSGDNFQHASIISREYGIPCVIQTKEATAKIFDGQRISVDGTAGTVTLNPMD